MINIIVRYDPGKHAPAAGHVTARYDADRPTPALRTEL